MSEIADRHLAVAVLGLLLTVLVTAASVQDRDAAKPLLWNLRRAFPSVKLAWADGGYAGKLVTWASTRMRLRLDIVKRPDDLRTFQVLPRRGVVERGLDHPPPQDRPRLQAPGRPPETYVYWAMIIVMTRRLARKPQPAGTRRARAGRISRDAALQDGRIQLHRAGWGILLS
jgi:hypothetical protein